MSSKSAPRASSPVEVLLKLKERGARVSDEVIAGLGVCALSVCGMFVNMQLVIQYVISGPYGDASQAEVAANGEVIAATWFVTMLVAFAATVLIGVVARLPLVQTTSLGLSSVLVSLMGTASGLTYSNVLLLSFLGAVVFAVLMGVPQLRRLVLRAIPDPVRRALPAAAGLLIAYVALQLSGLVSVEASSLPAYGAATTLEAVSDDVSLSALVSWGDLSYSTDKYHPLLLIVAVSCVFALALYPVARRRRRHPFAFVLLVSTVVFFALYAAFVLYNWKSGRFSTDSVWARLWMGGGEDAQEFHVITGAILSNLSIGTIFSTGMDFSAYVSAGGNVALLVAGSVTTFVVMSLASSLSTVDSVLAATGVDDTGGSAAGKALACNALACVIAPVAGVSPLTVSPESYAGAEDRAKTPIASLVAALGYLVNAVVWVFPFFMATVTSYDITFNMVGHYGFVMQLLAQCGFAIADTVMVVVGLTMAARSLDLEWRKFSVASAFFGTVAGTFFTSNIALGVACGTLCYVLAEGSRKGSAVARLGEEKSAVRRIGVPTLVLAVLGAVLLVFWLLI